MRIAIISSVFPGTRRGGVPTYVDGRSRVLGRRHQVRLFALGGDAGEAGCLGSAGRFPINALAVWTRLYLGLIRFRPHRIEVHNIPVGLPVCLLVRGVRYFFHGPAAEEAEAEGASYLRVVIARALEYLIVLSCRRVHFVSWAFRQKFLGLYPQFAGKASRVVHPYLESRPQAIPWPGAPWGSYFICVRRLVQRTGVDLLLEAYDRCGMAWVVPPVGLLIAGDGPLRQDLEAQVGRLGSRDMIRFLGMVDEVTKDQLYAGAVANLVPTRALEGFGLVVVEAAMQGCPTIATEVDGLPEAIASLGEGGKVVAPEVEAMADALRSMPVQHDRASLRARAHAFYGIPPIVP